MEKTADTTTMNFRGLERETRFKRLERSMKRCQKVQSSIGRNDFANGEVSISTIATETNNSPGTREFLKTSAIGSEVLASSYDPRRMRRNTVGGRRPPILTTSSVKNYSDIGNSPSLSLGNASKDLYSKESKGASKATAASSVDSTRAKGSDRRSYKVYRPVELSCVQERRGARFACWTIMLSESGKLIVKGNLIGGSYFQTSPILRTVSAKTVETINKSLYTLEGNISDENNELPNYVREKFLEGFPDDWESVYQTWLSFVSKGRPVTFRWPTALADSDDDLRSEITDVTVEWNSPNLRHSGRDFPLSDCSKSERYWEEKSVRRSVSPAQAVKGDYISPLLVSPMPPNQPQKEQEFSPASERSYTLPTRAEIDALYNNFLGIFDRLWLATSSSMHNDDDQDSNETRITVHQQQPQPRSSMSSLTVQSNGNIRLPSLSPFKKSTTIAHTVSRSAHTMPRADRIDNTESPKSSARLSELSSHSDECESDIYAGVRRISVDALLSQRRAALNRRKRMTPPVACKSRNVYARSTSVLRTRNIHSDSLLHSNEEEHKKKRREDEGMSRKKSQEGDENRAPRVIIKGTRDSAAVEYNQCASTVVGIPNMALAAAEPRPSRELCMDSDAVGGKPDRVKQPRVSSVHSPYRDNMTNNRERPVATTCQSELKNKPSSQEHRKSVMEAAMNFAHLVESVERSSSCLQAERAIKRSDPNPEEESSKKKEPVQQPASYNANDSHAIIEENHVIRHDGEDSERLGEEGKTSSMSEAARVSQEQSQAGQCENAATMQLHYWTPRVVRKSDSDLDGNLVFSGQLFNRAGHLVKKKLTTDFVKRRLSRSVVETADSKVYQLVGSMVDKESTVPRNLLTQCRDGCPTKIKEFCRRWIASLADTDDRNFSRSEKSRDASMKTLNVSVSSKGRRILPPLSYWTGERVVFKDNIPVYNPGIDADTCLMSKSNDSSGCRTRKRKKLRSSTSADSNTESSSPLSKKIRKINRGSAVSSEVPKEMPITRTKSQRTQQPAWTEAKSRAAPTGESDGNLGGAIQTRNAERRNLRHKRFTLPTTGIAESSFNVASPAANLRSSTGRGGERVSYNFYKNCPSQEDVLSDDQVSHV